jgi:hypothetical protein
MKARALWLFLVSICWVVPAMAADEERPMEIRPAVGIGINPDQALLGGEVFLRPRVIGLRIAPAIDFGFGDNVSTMLLSLDLLTPSFALNERSGIYGGAGVTVAFFNPDIGDNHTEANLNLTAGVDIRRFFIEGRFGLDKLPDVRLLGGIRFVM